MSDVARSLSYRVTVRSESRFVSPPPVRIKSLALSQSDLTASSDMAMRANGGRHECARHIRRHLGWAPEPSVNHRLGCASASLVGIDRLLVREISARAPLRARRSRTLQFGRTQCSAAGKLSRAHATEFARFGRPTRKSVPRKGSI